MAYPSCHRHRACVRGNVPETWGRKPGLASSLFPVPYQLRQLEYGTYLQDMEDMSVAAGTSEHSTRTIACAISRPVNVSWPKPVPTDSGWRSAAATLVEAPHIGKLGGCRIGFALRMRIMQALQRPVLSTSTKLQSRPWTPAISGQIWPNTTCMIHVVISEVSTVPIENQSPLQELHNHITFLNSTNPHLRLLPRLNPRFCSRKPIHI